MFASWQRRKEISHRNRPKRDSIAPGSWSWDTKIPSPIRPRKTGIGGKRKVGGRPMTKKEKNLACFNRGEVEGTGDKMEKCPANTPPMRRRTDEYEYMGIWGGNSIRRSIQDQ